VTWRDQAACRGVEVAEFFGGRRARARGVARCRVCPVAEVCFWFAVVTEAETGYRFGIWGGASPAVRAQVAWVTGSDHARVRLSTVLAEWAQARSGRERFEAG